MRKDDRPTVFSTSGGGDLRKKEQRITVPKKGSVPPEQQTVYLHRESKGRGGKVVSVVKGLQLSEKDLKALAKQLKKVCGSGGTIKDGVIEIQGENREKMAKVLEGLKYTVKIAGG